MLFLYVVLIHAFQGENDAPDLIENDRLGWLTLRKRFTAPRRHHRDQRPGTENKSILVAREYRP